MRCSVNNADHDELRHGCHLTIVAPDERAAEAAAAPPHFMDALAG
jgi:hypothetical protein